MLFTLIQKVSEIPVMTCDTFSSLTEVVFTTVTVVLLSSVPVLQRLDVVYGEYRGSVWDGHCSS